MSDHLTVGDAMIAREDCARDGDTVGRLADRFARGPIGPVLVLNQQDELIGEVRLRSLLRAMTDGAGPDAVPTDRVIAQRGPGTALTTRPEMTLPEAREAILASGADHLRVERDGTLAGIVPRAVLLAFTYRAPDGLPLPPLELTELVTGVVPPANARQAFFESGALCAAWIATIMRAQGCDMRDLDTLLDFGCGCGRVIRHWHGLAPGTQVYGTDYDPRLVSWCSENLPFARFEVNGAEPGISFEDESLQFVYGLSVFTHLPAELQEPWMQELTRVLVPGGALLVTLHGESRTHDFTDSERQAFASGEVVVRNPDRVGEGVCAAFHPERYVRETFAGALEIATLVPNGAVGMNQDVVVLRKPA